MLKKFNIQIEKGEQITRADVNLLHEMATSPNVNMSPSLREDISVLA